ncbi:MAG: translesion DNA synthesis-associated protein ImuA [Pseudomonadota bacterium]
MPCAATQSASPPPGAAHPAFLPDVWRASELARSRGVSCPTGHAALDAELPDKGWPRSTMIELLLQQSGIGEIHLLRATLAQLSRRHRIAIVQPPYLPNSAACTFMEFNCPNLLWIRAPRTADALWSTEQILRNGSCGAVLLWQSQIRGEALRRLNLAAQGTETFFWLLRPLAAAADASPAPLRLALRPSAGGVSVQVVKRRGPHHEAPLFIALAQMPARHNFLDKHHAVLAQRTSAPVADRVHQAALV